MGFECWLAGNGQEALQRLQGEATTPDLVLVDVGTPGAARLLQAVRAVPRLSQSPIVLMTEGRDVPPDASFDGVVVKPFDVQHLLQTLRSALHNRQALMGSSAGA